MSEVFAEPDLPPPESEPASPRRRSWAWLAWIVILGLGAFMYFGRHEDEDRAAARDSDVAGLVMKMQGRNLVGAANVFHQKVFNEKTAEALRHGGVDQRLRFVVLANELAGSAEALKELDRLDQEMAQYQVQPTADQARLRHLLGRLFEDYRNGKFTGPSLTPADRTFVRQHLDWFGDLALAPEGLADQKARSAVLAPADRFIIVFILIILLGAFFGLAGFAGLIVLIVFVFTGKVKGMQTGTGRSGVYAETFAVWLILFLGISLAVSRLLHQVSPLPYAGFMLLSLAALGWPVLRGIPWRQVREDLGLDFGRHPFLEPLIGLGCYAMAIPLVVIGVIATYILLLLRRSLSAEAGNPFAPQEVPSHPIVQSLAHGGWPELLGIIFLASVAAPLIEETMFRGVLYRHLREASARFGPVLSFFASGILVSFLFAVIHPQGIFAVPVLMALAFGFTMAREWRGTLVPAMVGHALNNGIVTLVLAAALGD
jgi:membrane protease YdiL (CAAX protease family)